MEPSCIIVAHGTPTFTVHILCSGPARISPHFPSEVPLPMGDLDPFSCLIRGSFGPPKSATKCHFDRFSRFCTANPCAQHKTHRTMLCKFYFELELAWSAVSKGTVAKSYVKNCPSFCVLFGLKHQNDAESSNLLSLLSSGECNSRCLQFQSYKPELKSYRASLSDNG